MGHRNTRTGSIYTSGDGQDAKRRVVDAYRGSVGLDIIVPAAQESKMYLEGIEEDHDDDEYDEEDG